MIGIRGLTRWLVNDQHRLARLDHHLAPADFRGFHKPMEGAQRSQLVVLRVDSLDAFDRRLERERQASPLQRGWRMSLANFSSKRDACELVNGIPQLRRRIAFDGFNDAGKNHRKANLRQSRRKVLSAADFLRLRGHLKTSGALGAIPAK